MPRYDVPRALAIWGMLTYASMMALALVSILVPGHPELLADVLYGLGGAFELVFGAWLLVCGLGQRHPNLVGLGRCR